MGLPMTEIGKTRTSRKEEIETLHSRDDFATTELILVALQQFCRGRQHKFCGFKPTYVLFS